MEIEHACKKFFDATQIPMQIFSGDTRQICFSNSSFDINPAKMIMCAALETAHHVCYTLSPENFYSGLIRVNHSDGYIIIGPVLISQCSRLQAQKTLNRLNVSIDRTFDFISWLNKIPLYDIQRFQSCLTLLDYLVNQSKNSEVIYVPYRENESATAIFETIPEFIDHLSDLTEKEILSCIEYGKVRQLESLIDNMGFTGDGIPEITQNDVRNFKNIVIFSTAIASRTAIRGGLDYDTSMAMTSNYLGKVETLNNTTDIFLFLKQMFLDFTKRVAKIRALPSESLLVSRICKEINSCLYEKITPTIISKKLNMNPAYLCTHFKKETGKTITEYINEVKIRESMRLLTLTELSIQQISEQFGFASSNYYHSVFKKITDLTPLEYRKKYHF